MKRSAVAFVVLLAIQGMQLDAKIGAQPAPSFGARDIFDEYKLPRLKDQAGDSVWSYNNQSQVLTRARKLGLNAHSATEAWMGASGTYERAESRAKVPRPGTVLNFKGTRASELNVLLAKPEVRAVKVLSANLDMDAPIMIARGNLSLDLDRAHLRMSKGGPYLIQVKGAQDLLLSGGVLTGQGWGVLVAGSREVAVLNMELNGLSGGGLLVTGSQEVTVRGNQFHRLGAASVLLHGATSHTVVADNEITDNVGGSNWHAGIVVTDRNANLAADPRSLLRDDNYGVREQRITERLVIPQNNVIAYNHIGSNLGSGIYLDGAARTVIAGNRVDNNSKEGVCLDNGSTANVVAFNHFEANGKRWGRTDEDLKRDFIFNLGRMPDGSSPAKVPAISIDNAAYNQVMFNEIDRNFGGGIKMVRSGFYNVLGLNTLSDNNEGRSKVFHFFGIELGAATADVKVIDLDFAPSRGNEIFGNIIRGSHYAGVFFAEGSDNNVLFDNAIFGATDWAMESVKIQWNDSFNNLTNQKLRNIGSGLDPLLLKLGAGEFDRR